MDDGDGKPAFKKWRELAARMQNETDPVMMVELAQQLVASYEDDKLRGNILPDAKQGDVHFPESKKP